MRQRKTLSRLIGSAVVLILGSVALPASAASMEDIAAVVGESHGAEWTKELATRLEHLGAGARIASASYSAALTAFRGQRINGTPDEVATLIFDVVVHVDRELRRGATPGKIVLDARRAVATLEADEGMFRESAQRRLRWQIATMGPLIYGGLERRAGPQSGPGGHTGASGPGPMGGGTQGGSGPSGSGSGETAPVY